MLHQVLIVALLSGAQSAPAPPMRPAPRRKAVRRAPPVVRRNPSPAQQERYRILGNLSHHDPQRRADAAWQAGLRRLRAAGKVLRRLLRDKDPLVRRNAAFAIGRIGDPVGVLPLYARIIREPIPDVTAQLAIALGRLRYPTARPLLLGLLARRDPVIRTAAITALGFLGDPGDVYTLGRYTRSSDPVLRHTAAAALGHLGSRTALRPLQRLLADPSAAVQRAAVTALAKLGARSVIPGLMRLLGKAPEPVQLATVRALASLDALHAAPRLLRFLAVTKSPRLAAEVARAAAHLGGRVPSKRIQSLLASRSNAVRILAAQAAGLAGARSAIPALTTLLDHAHPELRLACSQALGRLAAHQAVPQLVRRLRLARGPLRVQHIDTLARLRAVSALPDLSALLRDGDKRVVAAAAAALGELALQDRRPLQPLAAHLARLMMVHRRGVVAKEAALAFARLRPRGHRKGFARMARLTFHGDAAVRARVARALGLYGDRLARAALARLLGDKVATVQAAAAVALARLRTHKATGRIHALLMTTPMQHAPLLRATYSLALAILDRSRRPEAERAIRTALESGPNTRAKAAFVGLLATEGGRWLTKILQQARRSPSYLVRAAARRALSIWPPPVRPTPRVAIHQKKTALKKAIRAGTRKQDLDESFAGPYSAPKKRARGCGCSAGDSPGTLPIPILLTLLWLIRRSSRCQSAVSDYSQSLENL